MINRIILIGLFVPILEGQTNSILDTINIPPYKSEIRLQHNLILDTTFSILGNGDSVEYSIDPINGFLYIDNQSNIYKSIIVKYDHYTIPFPINIGLKREDLPLIDSLILADNKGNNLKLISPLSIKEKESIYSSGTFYRNLNIGSKGGSEFSGGFQMQIQGSLNNDIAVSGVLSDQNFPIQPDGNTSNLDEIDKIFFQINHKDFEVVAGDIDVNIESGKYFNIKRKTVGVNNQFRYKGLSASGSIAGSKGKTHQIELKGVDGKQGPYSLTAKNGNKDIVIIAGSERVWLNGLRLFRGEDYDYTIDYSLGEISFMPKNLIFFDTDLYIEYEYADEQYNRNLFTSSLNKKINNKGNLQLSWIREFDQNLYSNNEIDSELLSIFKNSGDREIYISGALEDSIGKYVMIDSIYIFDSTNTIISTHYQVSFTYDSQNGEYVRRISNNGVLFYEWVDRQNFELSNKSIDYYSPIRQLVAPESHQLIQALSNYHVNNWLDFSFELALSDYDQNRISNIDDSNNQGFGHQIVISGDQIVLYNNIIFAYEISQWGRNKRFHVLQRDRSINFNQDWNIIPESGQNEIMKNINSTVSIDSTLLVNTNFSSYRVGSISKQRSQLDFNGKYNFLNSISGKINQVRSNNENFETLDFDVKLFSGSIHPVMNYKYEFSDKLYHFNHLTSGIQLNGKRLQSVLGFSQREDYIYEDNKETLFSKGYFGEFDIKYKSRSEWNHSVVYRKRIKTEYKNNQNINYDLLQARSFFRKSRSPLRFDAKFKIEEVLTEERITLYDSVGVGFGTHRYDMQFEEYIPDPNGPYISYTVLSGSRRPTTEFEGIQRLEYDFSKKNKTFLKNIKYRMDWKWDFNGNDFVISQYRKNNLNSVSIVRSNSKILNEISYFNQDGNQIKVWNINERDLNNMDPRGPDLRKNIENGFDYLKPILNDMHFGLKIDHHQININSSFSLLRDRSVTGYWSEIGLKKRYSSLFNLEAYLLLAYDKGTHQLNKYSSTLRGIQFNFLQFLNSKVRIQSRFEWSNVTLFGGLRYLPPEALKGNSIGENKRVNISGNIFLKENFSINININYISDIRYNNFINLNGELRAYF